MKLHATLYVKLSQRNEDSQRAQCTKHMQHAQCPADTQWSSNIVSFLQLKQKLVTCSLSSRDPITALNSHPVTMLTHN